MNAASFRFRPASRLLLGKDFTAVFANRRVLRNGPFELYYKPLPTMTDPGSGMSASVSPRLGLVVPKRNAKRAVHRNLIKRLAREAFRHVCAELPAFDLVLRLGKPLGATSGRPGKEERQQWRAQIDELLRRVPRPAAAA